MVYNVMKENSITGICNDQLPINKVEKLPRNW